MTVAEARETAKKGLEYYNCESYVIYSFWYNDPYTHERILSYYCALFSDIIELRNFLNNKVAYDVMDNVILKRDVEEVIECFDKHKIIVL